MRGSLTILMTAALLMLGGCDDSGSCPKQADNTLSGSCDVPADTQCTYDCGGCGGTMVAVCLDGEWQILAPCECAADGGVFDTFPWPDQGSDMSPDSAAPDASSEAGPQGG